MSACYKHMKTHKTNDGEENPAQTTKAPTKSK